MMGHRQQHQQRSLLRKKIHHLQRLLIVLQRRLPKVKILNVTRIGSSDSDGSISSYDWDFGDGSSASGSSQYHVYRSAGTYSIELTVADDEGVTDTATTTVTVEEGNQVPSADLTFTPSNPVVGETVSFQSTSSDDGTITSLEWQFDDGSTARGESVRHAFSTAGVIPLNSLLPMTRVQLIQQQQL